MWIWIVLGAVVILLWKKPGSIARLANDTLKLEAFKELRAQGKDRQAGKFPTIEEMEIRFARKVIASSAVVFAVLMWGTWGNSLTMQLICSASASALYVTMAYRTTNHYRNVVLPLYMTLCRMQGASWDPHSPARRWVRVPRPKQVGKRIMVRLPKDWHASAMGVRMVEDIVRQRVPGEWKMRIDRPRFLVEFVPTATISVDVGVESERDAVGVHLDKEYDEIDMGNGPW